jgi:hypothetical protein
MLTAAIGITWGTANHAILHTTIDDSIGNTDRIANTDITIDTAIGTTTIADTYTIAVTIWSAHWSAVLSSIISVASWRGTNQYLIDQGFSECSATQQMRHVVFHGAVRCTHNTLHQALHIHTVGCSEYNEAHHVAYTSRVQHTPTITTTKP